jgi:PAS domain S-box-containing protein
MRDNPALHRSSADAALIAELSARLGEAEETLDAIRNGDIDAVLVGQAGASTIFTVENADRPYRFLIEQMKEGAMTLSEEGIVLYGNRRLAEILDAPLEKIVGSNLKRFFSEHQARRLGKMMEFGSSAPSRSEFNIEGMDGALTPIYMSINELESDPGEPRLLGAVITDLTQQHEMEARLSQAQKMEAVGQLTGGLAHDFNNLLQAICGNLSLIRLRPDDVQRVQKWAENALKAAASSAKLTSKLLAFSRSQEVDLQPVNARTLVHGMADMLLHTLGPGIEIRYALNDSTACVFADHTQLELAVLNLAINARDAMPGGGVLTISTVLRRIDDDAELPADDYLELSVTDSGAGMSEKVRGRAFDPFFTTKGVGEGTGLGLAQVYGIAKQAGGTARIRSTPGVGTTVSLLLRRSATETVLLNDAGYPVNMLAIGKLPKVLVIDDDDDVRTFMVESLELLGYRVSSASNGVAGLELIAANLPDVLVIDFAMPGMNGAEVVKRARQSGYTMPVIFASGYSDTSALNDAVGFKANVLLKPFSVDKLAMELTKALLPQKIYAITQIGAKLLPAVLR